MESHQPRTVPDERSPKLEGLTGVFKTGDDILISGQGDMAVEADQDHDRDLKALLDRERNIKLSMSKFKCADVQFIGHCLTKDGLKPEVHEILNRKKPDDLASFQRLIHRPTDRQWPPI